jgi:NADPH-dependent 2,4-dienoyl-CoA reductase/sulfur reductase-like enzyme
MSDAEADLVIVGSGPAGMAAACEARTLDLSVVLLDEQATIGGQIYRNIESAPVDRVEILGQDYVAGRSLASDFRNRGARYLGGAVVWNVSLDGAVDYVAGGSSQQVVGKNVLLASGAMERPFPIRGWTLPGVMGAGAAQILLKGSGALPTAPSFSPAAGRSCTCWLGSSCGPARGLRRWSIPPRRPPICAPHAMVSER